VRQEVLEREEQAQRNDIDLRNVMTEVQRLRSSLEENETVAQDKDGTVNRLTT
jgi:hypothetical protein